MQLAPAQLAAHLAKALAPLYIVHGDEPLLAIEAGDQIRAAARSAGCEEREVLVVEPGFKWDAFSAASRNLGLFGGRTGRCRSDRREARDRAEAHVRV